MVDCLLVVVPVCVGAPDDDSADVLHCGAPAVFAEPLVMGGTSYNLHRVNELRKRTHYYITCGDSSVLSDADEVSSSIGSFGSESRSADSSFVFFFTVSLFFLLLFFPFCLFLGAICVTQRNCQRAN